MSSPKNACVGGKDSTEDKLFLIKVQSELSLRGRGQEFSPATENVTPSYFHNKTGGK